MSDAASHDVVSMGNRTGAAKLNQSAIAPFMAFGVGEIGESDLLPHSTALI